MYPKNNASPPTIAVGSIYLIANGTIQTSGASVRVRTAGGAWGGGGGSLAYDTTSGCIEYTPTQAETNGEWFMVCVYKASCTSASRTVVTTAESTAGKVSLGGTQTANITGNLTGNVTGSVGSVTGAVGSVTGAVGSVTGNVGGNIGGNVTGSVGSVAAGGIVAASFGAGAIDAAAIANGAIDAATFAADVDAEIAAYVWNALTASYGTAGTYGEHVESLSAGGDATEAKQDTIIGYLDATSDIDTNIDTLLTRIPQTLNVTASGNIGIDWANVENPSSAVDLSATDIQLVDTCTTNSDTGDPWTTNLPGAYGAGSAGYIIGTNVNATISSRSSHSAANVVDEWETQSQADPTGFHVNVLEVVGVAQTGNDNGGDINTLLSRVVGTIAFGTHNAQSGDSYSRLGAPAGASVSADVAAVKTDTGNLVTRITATLFTGITSLAEWLGLIAGKQAGDATARTELRATGVGFGTYDELYDSLEALRDRGDLAWSTATGFSTLDAAGIRTAIGLSSANLDDQLTGISGYVDCLPATLDGSTFTSLPDVTTDSASRTASKADVSGVATPADVNAQVLDVINVDTLVAGVTISEALRRIGARTYKISGAGTGTETVTDWDDSASTIVYTVDASGNITAVTYN